MDCSEILNNSSGRDLTPTFPDGLELLNELPMYTELQGLLSSIPEGAMQVQQGFECVKESFGVCLAQGVDVVILDKHAKAMMERMRQLRVQLEAMEEELRSRFEYLQLLELIHEEAEEAE